MTALGMPGVSTWNFGEAFGHHYLDSVAMNHNSLGRGYETWGNTTAETVHRVLDAWSISKEWWRPFPPPREFAQKARISKEADFQRIYRESIDEPERFWGRIAGEIPWIEPPTKVLDWSGAPFAKWFLGGKLNASAVCLDQHLARRAQKRAIVWEGEPGDQRTLTYSELHLEVGRCANALKKRGVKKGDRVAIYMPMIPELVFAVLACARVGAIHSVIFGGFSAHSIRDRVVDGGVTAVITADGAWRRRYARSSSSPSTGSSTRCGFTGRPSISITRRTLAIVTGRGWEQS